MEPIESEALPHRRKFGDGPVSGPEAGVVGPVREAAAELVVKLHRPFVRQRLERPHVVVRKARPPVKDEQGQPLAGADHLAPHPPAGHVDEPAAGYHRHRISASPPRSRSTGGPLVMAWTLTSGPLPHARR